MTRTLHKVAQLLKGDEISILDAGICLTGVQEAGIARFVLRQRCNGTVRRNELPVYGGQGRHLQKKYFYFFSSFLYALPA